MIAHDADAQVRAQLEQPTSESEKPKDYVWVLNENLELFRKIEELKKVLEEVSKVKEAALSAQHKAEMELLKEKSKSKNTLQGHRSARKILVWCYFIISFLLTFLPSIIYLVLYVLHYSPAPQIMALGLLGIAGLIIIAIWSEDLANNEKEPS